MLRLLSGLFALLVVVSVAAWLAAVSAPRRTSAGAPAEAVAKAVANAEGKVRELRDRRDSLASELVNLRMTHAIADLTPDKDAALPTLPEVVAILRRDELRLDDIRAQLQGLRPDEIAAVAWTEPAQFDGWFAELADLGRSMEREAVAEGALTAAGLGAGHPARLSLAAKQQVIENQIAYHAAHAPRILDQARAEARRRREIVEAQASVAPPDAAVVARYRETKRQFLATEAELLRSLREREKMAAALLFGGGD